MLPLLPQFLRSSGSSPALVGIVMASEFAASVLTQYPVGRLCDRVGARPILLLGLIIFSVGSFGFAMTSGPWFAIWFRSLQGIGASAVTVALGAAIGAQVAREEQGRAFGAIYASQMSAFAIGPLLGSIAGVSSIRDLFVAGGLIALVAWFPIARLISPPSPDHERVVADAAGDPIDDLGAREGFFGARIVTLLHRRRDLVNLPPGIIGALAFFAGVGFLTGAYEACWTMLLHLRGASSIEIGISWTLFTLPFAVLSIPAGALAERVDRRKLAMISILVSAGFAPVYPLLHHVPLLISVGSVEALCAVLGGPAVMLIVTRSVEVVDQGAAQGAVGTARTAAMAVAAALSGALFGISPLTPFIVAAVVVVLCAMVMIVSWRNLPHEVSAG